MIRNNRQREIKRKLKSFPKRTVADICCSGNEYWANAAQAELKRRERQTKTNKKGTAVNSAE